MEECKPFLSNKMSSKEKIHLIEIEQFVRTDRKTKKVWNTFFSNIVKNLDTLRYSMMNPK